MTNEPDLCVGVRLLAAACTRSQPEPAAKTSAPAKSNAASIAWVNTQDDGRYRFRIRARQRRQEAGLPVLDRAWCPPCNHVKSTIFTREDFIAKSRCVRSGLRRRRHTERTGAWQALQRQRLSDDGAAGGRRQRGHAARRVGRARQVHAAARLRALRAARRRVSCWRLRLPASRSRPRAGDCSRTTRGAPTKNSWCLKRMYRRR